MRRTGVLFAAALLLLLSPGLADVALSGAAAAEPPEARSLDAACRDAPSGRFDDVSGTHRDGIDCIGWWGVTQGVGGGDYDPSGDVGRGQMASFLAAVIEMTGGELAASPPDAFGDDDGSIHETAIDQLAELGVVNGRGGEHYGPADAVTRGQMTTFLAEIWQARTGDALPAGADFFSDDGGSVHVANIDRAASAGLTGGAGDGTFVPAADVSRAQMGSFLARLLAALVDEGHVTYPPSAPAPIEQRDAAPGATTACEGSDVSLDGTQGQWHERDLAAGTSVDASSASWLGAGDDPVRVGGGAGICWQGGHIDGEYGADFTWDDAHETAAFSMYGPDMVVNDLRINLEGDLINLKEEAADFRLSGIHLSEGRDDCIENDYVHSGVLEDSLLDGCYTALSARPSSDRDDAGPDNEWAIRDNLIRLKPMEHVYKPEKYGVGPGHGQFFKWGKDGNAVGLTLHGNVFMAEEPPHDGDDFAFPDEYLRSCSDNVMVWLGDGEFPGSLPEDCFTLTTDRQVWDDAVEAWKAR